MIALHSRCQRGTDNPCNFMVDIQSFRSPAVAILDVLQSPATKSGPDSAAILPVDAPDASPSRNRPDGPAVIFKIIGPHGPPRLSETLHTAKANRLLFWHSE